MTQPTVWRLIWIAGTLMDSQITLLAQSSSNRALPTMVQQCETLTTTKTAATFVRRPVRQPSSTSTCGKWNWTGIQFDAQWKNGGTGQIGVQRFSDSSIIFRRSDRFGAFPGLTATYVGHLDRPGVMSGTVTFSWRGQNTQGTWTATYTTEPQAHSEEISASRAEPKPHSEEISASRVGVGCGDSGRLPSSSEAAIEMGKVAASRHNDSAAFGCFLWAALQGNAGAQVSTGYAYEIGIGVRPNIAEALRWYLESAKQGNTSAQFDVSRIYAQSSFGFPNAAEAARWTETMWKFRTEHSQVCASIPVMDSMSRVELRSIADPSGQMLGGLAALVTGVRFKDTRPQLIISSGTDVPQAFGRFHVDMGLSSGDFLCEGKFLRGHVELSVEDDAGVDTHLTKEAAEQLLRTIPWFEETFRIHPLGDGRFEVALVPTSLELARTYKDITVPQ